MTNDAMKYLLHTFIYFLEVVKLILTIVEETLQTYMYTCISIVKGCLTISLLLGVSTT